MSFKIAARTILQLGAELISSDAVAFYELIKNAFDAASPDVNIGVVIRIDHEDYILHREQILSKRRAGRSRTWNNSNINKVKNKILKDIDLTAPDGNALKNQVLDADSWDELLDILDEANYISIEDTGSGMSLKDLSEIYLTIGTRSRLKDRKAKRKIYEQTVNKSDFHPILGEKGIGRLSTMRLGSRLWVETSKKGEKKWNNLEIDWDRFSNESDEIIEDIQIHPGKGDLKEKYQESGTTIWISALSSNWSKQKLINIAVNEFSKLMDPFTPRFRFPISIHFNEEPIKIPRFDKILFEAAHAKVKAKYALENGEPYLSGKVDYLLRNREKTFSLDFYDLKSITKGILSSGLKSLGPFKTEFYWFNRQTLKAVDGIGDRKRVQKLVADWAGGLMVFRDGFRVYPYGNPEDDWLNLDRKALASAGYKVNRRQIIGKVDISSMENTALLDQTNREGLRDCSEKTALINLLKHILEAQFRTFLNTVDAEVQAKIPVSFDDFDSRVWAEEKRISQSLKFLKKKYAQVAEDKELFSTIEDAIDNIRSLMDDAKELAESYESGQTQLLNLAGLGLMVEIVAHELNRATRHTLRTLANTNHSALDEDIESVFGTLEAQLKTLQKRLRILDPISTSGRQVKEKFDLIDWVKEIILSHEAQFKRHDIKYYIKVKPPRKRNDFPVKMVKGMIVQIMENLLSNSVYWLKQQATVDKDFEPEITVIIDTLAKKIHLTDNGPGVPPQRKEEIFQPFVTTKPPGEGKGLGLFISREIAKHNVASLYMSDETLIHDDRLNTFVFSLEVDK
ncbi:ATP-binding protein [Thermodesulfobacteriota bacterium]